MADYTPTEVQTAVEKVIRSSVRTPYGILGNRDTAVSFNDLQEAAAGVFALNSNAPFYVVFLGTERLTGKLKTLEETVSLLIEAVENMNRRVTPIDDLTPLANARAALLGLETAAAARTGSFEDVTVNAAYKRYDDNTSRFLEQAAKNIRKAGAIVPTPQESRKMLGSLVNSLKGQRTAVVNRAFLLSVAILDYDALSLPAVLAAGVASRARQVLDGRLKELESLSPSGRLEIIRDVTLDLLVGQAAVKNVTSLRATTKFARIEGAGQVFADVDHLTVPASLSSETHGPYPIVVGADELYLTTNGADNLLVLLAGSFLASLRGSIPPGVGDTYDIDGTNDELRIQAGADAPFLITLITGSRTVEQIVADINTGITLGQPVEAYVAFASLRFLGTSDITNTSPTTADFTSTTGINWEVLNVRVGDEIHVVDPTSANDGSVYVVDSLTTIVLACTLVTGVVPVTEVIIGIEIGTLKVPALRVPAADRLAHLTNRWPLQISPTDDNIAADELGFPRGNLIFSRATSAQEIADQFNLASSASVLGVPKVVAEVEFADVFFDGLGRTDPDDTGLLVAYRLRARGDTAGGGPSNVVYTVTGAATAGVVIGDTLVIRDTPTPADLGVQGLVTAVDDTEVEVTMGQAVSPDTAVLVEVGPTIILTEEYLALEATGFPGGQDAIYQLAPAGQQSIAFDFRVESAIPGARGQGGQPVFGRLRLGHQRVVFRSQDETLATKVEVNDTFGSAPAAGLFFASLPASAVGTTIHFSLPENPQVLSDTGDELQLFENNPSVVSQAFPIVGLELSKFLVRLAAPGLPTDQADIAMSLAAQVPFAKVRLGKKNNYTVLQEALGAWAQLAPIQLPWLRELDRLVADIQADKNPTISQVNTLKLHLQAFLSVVTRQGAVITSQDQDVTLEAALSSYQVTPEDDVDTLVDTYMARGSERGIAVLLRGSFQVFFGLSAEDMSFSGAVRSRIREVTRLDLPIRKTGRSGRHEAEAVEGVFTDIDYDFDESDLGGDEDIGSLAEFDETDLGGR